jgi:hypothetical protein
MGGYPEFNFPAFNAAAAKLRAQGHEVFNPAERDNEKHGTLREALGADLAWICAEANAIALLPGHERSKGATAELATAVALRLEVILLEPQRMEYAIQERGEEKQ